MRASVTFALSLAVATPVFAADALPVPVRRLEVGPAPRAGDGRFENLEEPISRGSFGVRLGFFARRFVDGFRSRPGAPARVANDGRALRGYAADDPMSATWIGHATVLLQVGGSNWLTDPIWSETASPVSFAGPPRFVEPGVALDDLPEIHGVLISHNHYDHLDLATLRALAKRGPETLFLVPRGDAALLRGEGIARVVELDWGEAVRVRGLEIYCLPAQHWSRRGLLDERRSLWASWAIIGSATRVFFAGDTGFFAGFEQIGAALGPFDLAALPIGAYEPQAMMHAVHLNPEEAVQAALDLRAENALGIHFGTFGLTDEPLDEPPARFRAAAERAGRAHAFWTLRVGETRPILPGGARIAAAGGRPPWTRSIR